MDYSNDISQNVPPRTSVQLSHLINDSKYRRFSSGENLDKKSYVSYSDRKNLVTRNPLLDAIGTNSPIAPTSPKMASHLYRKLLNINQKADERRKLLNVSFYLT